MFKKLFLITPIISSLVFGSTAAALTSAENAQILNAVWADIGKLTNAINEFGPALTALRNRNPADIKIDDVEIETLIREMRQNLKQATDLLTEAGKSGSRGEFASEAATLKNALRDIQAILYAAYQMIAAGYFQDIAEKITQSSVPDKIREKLNAIYSEIGGVAYSVSISGGQDIKKSVDVILPTGDVVTFHPGRPKTQTIRIPFLGRNTNVTISIFDGQSSARKNVAVSLAAPRLNNCSAISEVGLQLSVVSGSVVADGATGYLKSIVARGYQQPIVMSIDLGSGGELPSGITADMAEILKKAPALLVITGDETGTLHTVKDGAAQKFDVYDDSMASLAKFYEKKYDIKNLENFLALKSGENSEAFKFLAALTNLEEKSGLALLLYPKSDGGIDVYAKKLEVGSYEKIYESLADKLSVGYTAEGGLNIFISDKELTKSEVNKILGKGFFSAIGEFFGGADRPSYDVGYKLLSPGWLVVSKATGLASGVSVLNLALAQEDINEGGGGFFVTAGEIVSSAADFGSGSAPADAPSQDALLGSGATSNLGGSGGSSGSGGGGGPAVDVNIGGSITIRDNGTWTVGGLGSEPIPYDPTGGSGDGELRPGFTIGDGPGFTPNPEADKIIEECFPGLKNPWEREPFGGGTTPVRDMERAFREGIQQTGDGGRTIPTGDDLRNPPPQLETPSGGSAASVQARPITGPFGVPAGGRAPADLLGGGSPDSATEAAAGAYYEGPPEVVSGESGTDSGNGTKSESTPSAAGRTGNREEGGGPVGGLPNIGIGEFVGGVIDAVSTLFRGLFR